MDHLCDQLSETICRTEKPYNLFCRWDSTQQECKAFKDRVGNVCCQTDPGNSACHDILIKQKCPEGFEVKASCCQNTKWKGLTTREGYVCCNAPCKDADDNGQQCTPLPKCWQRSSVGGVLAQDYGISSAYVYGPQTYGDNYADIYSKIDNTQEYENYKTPEVTADNIVEMIVKALEKDEHVVEHDETLHTSPYGTYAHETYPNYAYNFIHPEFEYRQIMSAPPSVYNAPLYRNRYGYGGYGGYNGGYNSYGYGQSHGGRYGSYNRGYGDSYGSGYHRY